MELFRGRRWRLISAKLSNNVFVLFWHCINATAYHFGQWEPLHFFFVLGCCKLDNSCRGCEECGTLKKKNMSTNVAEIQREKSSSVAAGHTDLRTNIVERTLPDRKIDRRENSEELRLKRRTNVEESQTLMMSTMATMDLRKPNEQAVDDRIIGRQVGREQNVDDRAVSEDKDPVSHFHLGELYLEHPPSCQIWNIQNFSFNRIFWFFTLTFGPLSPFSCFCRGFWLNCG